MNALRRGGAAILRKACACAHSHSALTGVPSSLRHVPPGILPESRWQSSQQVGWSLPATLRSLFSSQTAALPVAVSDTPDLNLARTKGAGEDQEVCILNFRMEDCGRAVLGGDIFDVEMRPDIVHRVVRWQLAKRRQGTHSTKGVGEVRGTSRKPWKQKGLGKARAGSLRGPQFRGGATMHGPKPRSHAIGLPKKVRQLGMKVALSARMAEGRLFVFDGLVPPSHKTKEMEDFVGALEGSKKVLMVEGEQVNDRLKRATANLHYTNVLPSIGLNVYSILQHDTLVLTLDAVRKIEERLRFSRSSRIRQERAARVAAFPA